MPPRKKPAARKNKKGGSKFTDFFTKTIPNAAKTVYTKAIRPAYDFARRTKAVSRVARAVGQDGFANQAEKAGFGKRKGIRKTAASMTGGGLKKAAIY